MRRVGSFTDRATAEWACHHNAENNDGDIAEWLSTGTTDKAFDWVHDRIVGRCSYLDVDGQVRFEDVSGSRMVLTRSADMPGGYRIHTAYPVQPPEPGGIARSGPGGDALWILFGAYLHQDHDTDYGDWAAAVHAYGHASPAAEVSAAIKRSQELMDSFPIDHELGNAVYRLGLEGHSPPRAGQTYRAWLGDVVWILNGYR